VLARCNGEAADSAHNRGVRELRLSRNDRVRDVMIKALSRISDQHQNLTAKHSVDT